MSTLPINLSISRKAVDFIVMEEVSSIEYYNRALSHPTYPGGDSGVTIGIGYDLGYNSRQQIIADWRNRIKESDLQILLACSGLKKEDAKRMVSNSTVKSINIPYTEAWKVFVRNSLPRFAKNTLQIYPGLQELFPDAIGALVSMVFNRGNDISKRPNDAEDRRKEMRAIVPLVAAKDYSGIADQIDASKRLWVGKGMNGLVTRREKEASLVRNSMRQYSNDELLNISI